MNPVVKHGTDEMRAEYLPRVAVGRAARRVRCDRARCRHRHDGDHDAGHARGRPLHRPRPQGLDDEGALLPEGAAARAHHTARAVHAPHRRDDPAARRSAASRGRHPPDLEGRTQRGRRRARCATTICRSRSPIGSARRARASATSSTASTPSASSSRPRRSASGSAAIRKAVAYANDRVVFGRPIGKNQGIAFPLAEAYARLHAAELAVCEAPLALRRRASVRRAGQHRQVARRGRGVPGR